LPTVARTGPQYMPTTTSSRASRRLRGGRTPAPRGPGLTCSVLSDRIGATFAPHAMPKLGGGVEGFQIDLFTEVARRMKREITIDAVSFSTLIPGMQSGRYDFIAAPTTVTKERAENMLF